MGKENKQPVRQVWHTIVALEPDDVEMVREVGLAPASLFVESCANCTIAFESILDEELESLARPWIKKCAHHREMSLGGLPQWHLVGSRVVEVGE